MYKRNKAMDKNLSEMSLEELWQLFPIFLTEHQDCWEKWYADDKIALWLPSFADVDAEYERLSKLSVQFPTGEPMTFSFGIRNSSW